MNLIRPLALASPITIIAGISYAYPHPPSGVPYPSQTSSHLTASRGNEPPSDGAAIYEAKCTTCHAGNGSGDTPVGKRLRVRDLRSADVQKKSDADLTKIISHGKGKMPPYSKILSSVDIQVVVAYIRTLKK